MITDRINKTNKRRKSGGDNLKHRELMAILPQESQITLKKAALDLKILSEPLR
ncbi:MULTISPECIES: hypothetical protein [unclassified Nodularia (in: cyanobacteria)]|uniref:hypothetical protein n=1 Tax=unclassified Nodularia (in: cyanobacteria) TaxID=2656917 RepID=UPI00187E4F0A|nr:MULTISPECIES: hypothetical protein [unclassified Nodularia (in: cyanobacteria)]MBE9199799.1 hypothetical protein [Nodularia sp. LEGE 06071]MCC2692796.1 hypothetical protein [Nodularia sp. LEGE 04288]